MGTSPCPHNSVSTRATHLLPTTALPPIHSVVSGLSAPDSEPSRTHPRQLIRTIGMKKKEEQCRSSCRGVDSGETSRIRRSEATLPNLGMWTTPPNLPHPWTTRLAPRPIVPKPCGQSHRLSPALSRLSTCTYTLLSTLCPTYPRRSESYPHFHPKTGDNGVRTPLRLPFAHRIGENRGSVWIVYEGTVASYPLPPSPYV